METPFTIDGNRLVRRYDGETLCIEPWGADSLRVRATQLAVFPSEDWALLPPVACTARITIDPTHATIQNGGVRAEVERDGRIFFHNDEGKLLLKEFVRLWSSKTSPSALRFEGREYKPIPGGDFRLTVRFESDPTEKIFGMGQYQHPFLDLKGCILELAHRNSQASVPFALSSLGYGMLWNNPSHGQATFGKNYTEWTAGSAKKLDYWITAGGTPSRIVEAYARATGTAPMMPDYATGFWQCKLRYQTQEELLEVAREYRRRGLPLSVIVVDFFHWPVQGDWRFDTEYWPDPEGMVRELKDMGVELMVSVWPTVDKTSENYTVMLEKGYLMRTERGVRSTMQFMGDTVFFDATNPEAREYVWRKLKQNYYDKGIRIFWLDEAEPEYGAYDFDNYRFYAGPALQVGNIYPVLYAKTLYDGMTAAGQKDVLNLVRCAWAGSQRYGALVWSGDIYSSFESLRNQVRAGLNMGLAGIPWWTTDIGGFFGADTRDPRFHELLVRWFQYGAFCPVFRLHGDRMPFTQALGKTRGGLFRSGAPNEVWSYGEEVLGILTKHMLIREYLRPYVRDQMRVAHERGTPVMRPLFYDFPADPEAWSVDDAYLFGPDILVAPILYENKRARTAYLPRGADWIQVATGKVVPGGQRLEVEAPLDTIPLFVRQGSALSVVKLREP